MSSENVIYQIVDEQENAARAEVIKASKDILKDEELQNMVFQRLGEYDCDSFLKLLINIHEFADLGTIGGITPTDDELLNDFSQAYSFYRKVFYFEVN